MFKSKMAAAAMQRQEIHNRVERRHDRHAAS
jgi:hypothetical protein